jgi:hypothetical protein
MPTVPPSPQDKAIIKSWLVDNLHEVLNNLEVIPSISFNLPEDVGRANASKIKAINSVNLKDVHLVSLSYSNVEATVSASPEVSVDVSWDDYLSSSEVRDLVGETEKEFAFLSIYTEVNLEIKIHFELLKEPPMVASHKVLEVNGDSGGCKFS